MSGPRWDRRAFTLLELLVALALAGIMLGVLALAVQHTSRAGRSTLERIEREQALLPALEALRGDAAGAIAAPGLPGFFSATRGEQVLAAGGPTRLDTLELTLLVGQPPRLCRARWSVGWDPVEERGWLWRELLPVPADELPLELVHLAWEPGLAPPEPSLLHDDVTRFELGVGLAGGEVDPPSAGDPPLAASLGAEGVGGPLMHDLLWLPAGSLTALTPGCLVWLRDEQTQGPPAFAEGWYPFLRCAGSEVVLGQRVGGARRVAWRAAWLPTHVRLDLEAGGARERLVLPLDAGCSPLLEEAARAGRAQEEPP